jgi:hypothetical protein
MTRRSNTWILSLSVCFVLVAGGMAAAAEDPPAQRGAADAQGGPLVFEPITGGIVAAPEVKVTSIDNRARAMLGGYVGYLFDSGFLVAGGIDTEIDWHGHYRDRNWYSTYPDGTDGNRRDLTYAGGIVGWTLPGAHPVRPGVRALVGGGWARRNDLIDGPWPMDQGTRIAPGKDYGSYHDWQGFFVLEPQADVAVRLSHHLALDVAGGYRFITDSHGLDHQLRGASGSVSLQVGHF